MTILTGVVSYPIPVYSNVPIQPQWFQPSQFLISGITLGIVTTVTTFLDMNYVVGQEIRLLIPPTFGCRQLNGLTGIILSILANQVTVSIDSSQNVDEYIASSDLVQSAQIVAIGDVNNGQISSTGEVILPNGGNTNTQVPGAFINISPEA